jgi:hypothetical protein
VFGRIKTINDKLTPAINSSVNHELKESFTLQFSKISDFIRHHRNEAGHPHGIAKSYRDGRNVLILMETQSLLIAEIIDWLRTDKRY